MTTSSRAPERRAGGDLDETIGSAVPNTDPITPPGDPAVSENGGKLFQGLVAARTGGVPLFVEEVTRFLLERGEKGGIHVIPPWLQQSLMSAR